jgi:predicted TIM-barrel fold metal-dependent hydrolase
MIFDRLKSALPLDDVTVIDCHGHLGSWPLLNMPRNGVREIIETMDRLSIDRLCLSHFLSIFCDFRRGNDILGEVVGQYPERLIGQVVINPHYPERIVTELERCRREYGIRLAKIHSFCHEYPADGPGYRDFWQYANEKEMLVLAHTSDSDEFCSPELFGPIAREHPRVRIILAHAGVTQRGCEQTIRMVRQHDNLYLDTACSQPHVGMIEKFVREVGAQRVLFGSDVPVLDPSAQLGRIAYAKIKEQDKEKILGLNMKELLGEEEKEPADMKRLDEVTPLPSSHLRAPALGTPHVPATVLPEPEDDAVRGME